MQTGKTGAVAPEYVTTGYITTKYQVSLSTVYNAIKSGRLRAHKVGPKVYRFLLADVEAWARPYEPEGGQWPSRATTDEAPQSPIERDAEAGQ